MATAASSGFETWLEQKLLSLNPDIDTDVFVMYITGILDTETSTEDKRESIEDFLGEVVESDRELVCQEILKEWDKQSNPGEQSNTGTEALASQLSEILEKQSIESVKPKEKAGSDNSATKAAILAQYGNISDGEEEDPVTIDHGGSKGGASDTGGGGENLLLKIDNAEAVKMRELEKREKSKQEHEKKKEKDKLDREAQKQKQQERKDNEKKRTQKGERRR